MERVLTVEEVTRHQQFFHEGQEFREQQSHVVEVIEVPEVRMDDPLDDEGMQLHLEFADP